MYAYILIKNRKNIFNYRSDFHKQWIVESDNITMVFVDSIPVQIANLGVHLVLKILYPLF